MGAPSLRFCKGGYDAVCSMRFPFRPNRQCRPLWYPAFAKVSEGRGTHRVDSVNEFKGRATPRELTDAMRIETARLPQD